MFLTNVFSYVNGRFSSMMTEWKEHYENDIMDFTYGLTTFVLWECGLLKLFKAQNMKGKLGLLQRLIEMWDLIEQQFMVEEKPIVLEIEYIYFLTRILKVGFLIAITRRRATRWDNANIYVAHYYGTRQKK